jgi:hypothetical protein
MPNIITDHDVRNYVLRALDGREADFDIDGIVAAIMAKYAPFGEADTLDGAVDTDEFWGIVAAYDLSDDDELSEKNYLDARETESDQATWYDMDR